MDKINISGNSDSNNNHLVLPDMPTLFGMNATLIQERLAAVILYINVGLRPNLKIWEWWNNIKIKEKDDALMICYSSHTLQNSSDRESILQPLS